MSQLPPSPETGDETDVRYGLDGRRSPAAGRPGLQPAASPLWPAAGPVLPHEQPAHRQYLPD